MQSVCSGAPWEKNCKLVKLVQGTISIEKNGNSKFEFFFKKSHGLKSENCSNKGPKLKSARKIGFTMYCNFTSAGLKERMVHIRRGKHVVPTS